MIKDFYIFRHGQSTYNIAGRTQGQTNDSVLTELGKSQAEEIGRKLSDKGVEIIITSPLQRAVQTANLANQSLQVPIEVDERFIEVNVGVVEGMHYLDIKAKYPEIFDKMHSVDGDADNVCYPQGETRLQVRQRIFTGLNDWADKDKYKIMAVSSHGIMLSQTLTSLGQPATEVKNGSILHIRKENDSWKVIGWI